MNEYIPTAQSVNERVDTMGEWATGINESIAALRESLRPSLDTADEISAELGGLHADYTSVLGDVYGFSARRAEIFAELNGEGGVEGKMGDAEAQVYLEICAEMTPGTKPRYRTDKERADAFQRALARNDEHRQLNTEDDAAKRRQREIEDEVATAIREEMLPVERYSNEAKREAAAYSHVEQPPSPPKQPQIEERPVAPPAAPELQRALEEPDACPTCGRPVVEGAPYNLHEIRASLHNALRAVDDLLAGESREREALEEMDDPT